MVVDFFPDQEEKTFAYMNRLRFGAHKDMSDRKSTRLNSSGELFYGHAEQKNQHGSDKAGGIKAPDESGGRGVGKNMEACAKQQGFCHTYRECESVGKRAGLRRRRCF